MTETTRRSYADVEADALAEYHQVLLATENETVALARLIERAVFLGVQAAKDDEAEAEQSRSAYFAGYSRGHAAAKGGPHFDSWASLRDDWLRWVQEVHEGRWPGAEAPTSTELRETGWLAKQLADANAAGVSRGYRYAMEDHANGGFRERS